MLLLKALNLLEIQAIETVNTLHVLTVHYGNCLCPCTSMCQLSAIFVNVCMHLLILAANAPYESIETKLNKALPLHKHCLYPLYGSVSILLDIKSLRALHIVFLQLWSSHHSGQGSASKLASGFEDGFHDEPSQACTDLQSLVKCLDDRSYVEHRLFSQSELS